MGFPRALWGLSVSRFHAINSEKLPYGIAVGVVENGQWVAYVQFDGLPGMQNLRKWAQALIAQINTVEKDLSDIDNMCSNVPGYKEWLNSI